MDLAKQLDLVKKLIEKCGFSNPQLINELQKNEEIFRQIFVKALVASQNEFNYEQNYTWLTSTHDTINFVPNVLFNDKAFAQYCV
jgi:hypothetical protein